MQTKIALLGDGAWGTAVATVLAHNGYHVHIWCHNEQVAHEITKNRRNTYFLPDIALPDGITATTNIAEAVKDASWIFEAVPVKHLRSVLIKAKPYVTPLQAWVILSKGIEQETQLFPTEIVDDVLGYKAQTCVVSGPSFAHDISHKKITAVVVAADDRQRSYELQALLGNDYCKLYNSSDVVGVQVAGAIKNVFAVCLGMLEGAGYTDNTKAYILTVGLSEMVRLTVALGGSQATVYGLAGIGDLVLTSMGKHSRNVSIGKRLGAGASLSQLVAELGTMPEGINTIVSIYQIIQKKSLDLPLCTALYHVVIEGYSLDAMFKAIT